MREKKKGSQMLVGTEVFPFFCVCVLFSFFSFFLIIIYLNFWASFPQYIS